MPNFSGSTMPIEGLALLETLYLLEQWCSRSCPYTCLVYGYVSRTWLSKPTEWFLYQGFGPVLQSVYSPLTNWQVFRQPCTLRFDKTCCPHRWNFARLTFKTNVRTASYAAGFPVFRELLKPKWLIICRHSAFRLSHLTITHITAWFRYNMANSFPK